MQTKQIMLNLLEQEWFEERFRKIETALNRLEQKGAEEERYLSRKEVAEMLQIDLSTLHLWNKRGILQPMRLGNRVYYLSSDIKKALNKRQNG
jgi:predicted DNA-binding transcriptional regulator AlpA